MFKVPSKTSVFKINENSPKGVMKFAPELIQFIKDKRKFQTFRFADEKYSTLKAGQ